MSDRKQGLMFLVVLIAGLGIVGTMDANDEEMANQAKEQRDE